MINKNLFALPVRRLKQFWKAPYSNSNNASPKDEPYGKDTFCILAFKHLQIDPNGAVKMCCYAGEDIMDSGRTMSLYSDSYKDIWNSKYMRDARRSMSAGEKISACTRCYCQEASVGQSHRTKSNAIWFKATGKTAEDFLENARVSDWKVDHLPEFVQLNMGNLCNLACRMCSPLYSSRIENDPVHNKWAPAIYPKVASWQDKSLHFAPRPYFGVRYEGFYDYERSAVGGLRRTNGAGKITLTVPPGAGIRAFGIALRCCKNETSVSIRVNASELFHGNIYGDWTHRFERPGLDNQSKIEIELISHSTASSERRLGVAVLDAWLERASTPTKAVSAESAVTRFACNAPAWWKNKDVLFGEILSETNQLQFVEIQGGEPLLVKEFEEMLDLLIANGAASHVGFALTSNMTILKQSTLEKLGALKRVHLIPSIDGIGPYLEYIRYPANWKDIEEHLARVASLHNIQIRVFITVQVYNLLHVTEILRYCDKKGFDAGMHFLVAPQWLSVLVLPKIARSIAAERLNLYLQGNCRPGNAATAQNMLVFLAEHEGIQYRDDFATFVRFTNDMDKSRQQYFSKLYADHIEWFAEDGLEWTDETVHVH